MADPKWKGIVVKVGQIWNNRQGSEVEITQIRANVVYIGNPPSRFGQLEEDGTPSHWNRDWHVVRTIDQSVAKTQSHGATDGMFCCMCQQFFPYAVANRPSGKLACYSCRQGWIPRDL